MSHTFHFSKRENKDPTNPPITTSNERGNNLEVKRRSIIKGEDETCES